MRISRKELERLGVDMPKEKPRSKYGATKTMYNGVIYASKAEALRAEELDMMLEGGAIEWWIGQPKFRLGCPENVYVADFLVASRVSLFDGEDDGVEVWVEDVKGMQTPKFKKDLKLWVRYGPMPLHILKRSGKTFTVSIVCPE